MKQSTMDKLRNSFHFIIGATVMYFFATHTDTGYACGTITLSLVIGALLGLGWEYLMGYIFKAPISKLDVGLTMLGSLSGALTFIFFGNNSQVTKWSLCISGFILTFELIRILRIKYKNLNSNGKS